MNAKKWGITVVSVVVTTTLLFGFFEFFLDPLLQYGKDRGPLTYREYSEIYCNPGIAKNYDYNAILLGSSMVENTDVSELDELFDCTTIKVPYSGGNSFNHRAIMDVAYGAGKSIQRVFWSLDEYALITYPDKPRYPLPTYLYDQSRLNDLSYLLNLDIYYFYTLKDLYHTFRGRYQIMMRDGTWISNLSVYNRENALSSIQYPIVQKENKEETYYSDNLERNLQENILPLIDAHPETEFDFFLVPYSISYWYQKKQNGTLDAEIYSIRKAIEMILEYDNTKVFFFQNEIEIITNLNLYKDYTHFTPEINGWMSREMGSNRHLLTKETFNTVLDSFYRFLVDFDYDRFYTYQGLQS